MIHFLDTSVLAKRYTPERGTEDVRRELRRSEVAVSRVTFAEVLAAIARAHRSRAFDAMQRDELFARVIDDFRELSIVEVRAPLLAMVPSLLVRHPLRGYDVVQLASAIALRRTRSAVTFWCADGRLCDAAEAESLRTRRVD
jgi:predicted nucleic acid-binding protein